MGERTPHFPNDQFWDSFKSNETSMSLWRHHTCSVFDISNIAVHKPTHCDSCCYRPIRIHSCLSSGQKSKADGTDKSLEQTAVQKRVKCSKTYSLFVDKIIKVFWRGATLDLTAAKIGTRPHHTHPSTTLSSRPSVKIPGYAPAASKARKACWNVLSDEKADKGRTHRTVCDASCGKNATFTTITV